MLSPRDEDDDDRHLCIKCNTTIVGLDNYVKHRKDRCQKKADKPDLPPIDTLEPTYSLEHKPEKPDLPPIDTLEPTYSLEHKPEKPDLPPIDTLEPTYSLEHKTEKPELPAIDTLEPTYSLGADIFFQSLELQSSVKKTSLSRMTPPITKASDRKSLAIPSTSRDLPAISPLETNLRGEDWIGGHRWKIGTNEDNQTKLINAVASISGAVKKDIATSAYSIVAYNDYKGDDDSEESEDLDDDDDEEITTGGKWKPPPNYTGGKWRPASPAEWVEQEHLGGKWKPIMPDAERDEDYDAPPPGHTKGKWVPGAHEKTQIMQTTIQKKGSVQYWCGPCNRRLGSRTIYEKHLLSNLHRKKVLPENELEFSGHLEPMRSDVEKRSARPSRFVDDSVFTLPKKKRKDDKTLSIVTMKKKRKRKRYFVQCSGCKSRVRHALMGKHLISHYHFRKATQTQSSEYKNLILDNMDAIVHQSPFQCSPCKFYTNWLSHFIQHWHSDDHNEKITSIDGRYWCSFCKFECETSQEMLLHMSSSEHTEVIAVINRSMPIIIRKKTVIKCGICMIEFRYNVEAKKHSQKTGHRMIYSATDDYQEIHKCQHCDAKFKTSISLAAHLKSLHKQKLYFCLVCSRSFNSAEEAKVHRQTSEHRVRRKEKMKDRGMSTKDLSRKCPYCAEDVVLKNVLELKDHIRRVHPEIKKKCPACGMAFTLSQEVSRHVRSNACQYIQNPLNADIVWNCSKCLFTTDSQSECVFHEVLHTTPIEEVHQTKSGAQKVLHKYSCPICYKVFRKASLRQHLRQHTFERPFACSICHANFTRQSSLVNHSKTEHGKGKDQKLKSIDEGADASTSKETCGQCQKIFESKSALTNHQPNCSEAKIKWSCLYQECTFVAATSAKLARHRKSHGNRTKPHECPYCRFRTDQASHLKRHIVCHEGIKPYACPHCQFTCGSLENLRKHVLRSGRHPGMFLYACRCQSCEYKTNMATELRAHLTSVHSVIYDVKTAQEAVRKHLMVEQHVITNRINNKL